MDGCNDNQNTTVLRATGARIGERPAKDAGPDSPESMWYRHGWR